MFHARKITPCRPAGSVRGGGPEGWPRSPSAGASAGVPGPAPTPVAVPLGDGGAHLPRVVRFHGRRVGLFNRDESPGGQRLLRVAAVVLKRLTEGVPLAIFKLPRVLQGGEWGFFVGVGDLHHGLRVPAPLRRVGAS